MYVTTLCEQPRAFLDSILKLYAETTKYDLLMNNLVVRSRKLGPYKSAMVCSVSCTPSEECQRPGVCKARQVREDQTQEQQEGEEGEKGEEGQEGEGQKAQEGDPQQGTEAQSLGSHRCLKHPDRLGPFLLGLAFASQHETWQTQALCANPSHGPLGILKGFRI